MRRKLITCAVVTAAAVAAPANAIVGGQPVASDATYPWVAAIYTGSNPGTGQFCGGTLVAADVVVTAAHCTDELLNNAAINLPLDPFRVRDPAGLRLKVMVGSRYLGPNRGEHRYVSEVREHPNPDVDLTALVLEAPVTIPPIGYLDRGDADEIDAAGVTATILGWGNTSEGGNGATTLQVAQVPIVGDGPCGDAYSDPSWGWTASAMICAGYPDGGVDTCQGDSGGPMVVRRPNGAWVLAGATSFGQGCARADYPGVYAELRAAAAFIDTFA